VLSWENRPLINREPLRHGPSDWGPTDLRWDHLMHPGGLDDLNWGSIQLGLVALAFGGLQIWWISRIFKSRTLAKPLSEKDFRKSLEQIWAKRP